MISCMISSVNCLYELKKLKHIKSVVIGESTKKGVDFSPLAQVNLFGMGSDTLGSQD